MNTHAGTSSPRYLIPYFRSRIGREEGTQRMVSVFMTPSPRCSQLFYPDVDASAVGGGLRHELPLTLRNISSCLWGCLCIGFLVGVYARLSATSSAHDRSSGAFRMQMTHCPPKQYKTTQRRNRYGLTMPHRIMCVTQGILQSKRCYARILQSKRCYTGGCLPLIDFGFA